MNIHGAEEIFAEHPRECGYCDKILRATSR